MTTKAEVLQNLTDDDKSALVASLKQWQAAGTADPKIPLDYDADGDGKPDAWALDADGNLGLVTYDSLDETVYVSDGDDITNGGE